MLLAILASAALCVPASAQKKVKLPKPGKAAEIVFVGNSLTFFHDLPAMVRALGKADKPARDVTTVLCAPGGYTLQMHVVNPKQPHPLTEIKRRKADYVVLQEQSTRPVLEPELMQKYADKFGKLCKKAKSVPVWYLTYARQHQPQLQDKISEQYVLAHKHNGGLLAPVGRAWQQLLAEHKDLTLHLKDRVHPNKSGAYLSACVLYGTMFGGDVRKMPGKLQDTDDKGKPRVLVDLPQAEADMLRLAAAKVVAAQYPNRPTSKSLRAELEKASKGSAKRRGND